MSKRLDYFSTCPQAMEILIKQENYLRKKFNDSNSVTISVWELIKIRVSQINRCAFCIDMHSKDFLKLGESPERIYGLSAWMDMPLYSEIEKTALAWAELIISGKPVSEEQYQNAMEKLGTEGVVDLTIAVNAINSWNRIAKVFKPEVGRYKPN